MKCSVVILNWNGEQTLRQFLPSVLQHTQLSDVEIVVADNGSTDGSLSYLRTQPIRIITLDKNYGFAEGYNRALAQVEAQYTVLLNSDVEVTPHWLDTMLDYMDAHPETVAAQPKVLAWHSKQQYDNGEIPAIRFEHAGAAGGMMDMLGYPYCRGRLMTHVEEDHCQYDQPATHHKCFIQLYQLNIWLGREEVYNGLCHIYIHMIEICIRDMSICFVEVCIHYLI